MLPIGAQITLGMFSVSNHIFSSATQIIGGNVGRDKYQLGEPLRKSTTTY